MTDLTSLTKTALNAKLDTPLTASALKKTSKADLVAMFEAQPPKLTKLEKRVLVAYLDAGIDSNGAETVDAMLEDNVTWSDTADIATRTGLSQKQVTGVQSSLSSKGLLVITEEGVNGEGPVQQVLADDGVRLAFDLLAEGVEAKAKAERKPRKLEARVMVEPSGEMRAVRADSKKHKLLVALERGSTIAELCAATGWSKDTVSSAFKNDVASTGFGARRDEKGVYHLIFPKGVARIPVMTPDVTRAAAVAGCRG